MQASSYKVASPDKITTSTAATLALTPNQVNQINETLGGIVHSPFANNIFDQQAIVTAIVAYLTCLTLVLMNSIFLIRRWLIFQEN